MGTNMVIEDAVWRVQYVVLSAYSKVKKSTVDRGKNDFNNDGDDSLENWIEEVILRSDDS